MRNMMPSLQDGDMHTRRWRYPQDGVVPTKWWRYPKDGGVGVFPVKCWHYPQDSERPRDSGFVGDLPR